MTGDHPGPRRETQIRSIDELLQRAHAMEVSAAARYGEFASQMETHNNLEVAKFFRTLADAERGHATQVEARLAARRPTDNMSQPPVEQGRLEIAEDDELHYLMTPYHALSIALRSEERAFAFFNRLAMSEAPDTVRETALGLAEEEATHIRLIREWLARVPPPADDWAYDPDAPRMPE